MTSPSDCPECRDLFMERPLLQDELRHLAVKYGASAAESELNERFADEHAEHE